MASSAKHHLIFFLLITILSSSLLHITHARDSQFFSKTPSTTNTNVVVPNTIESKEPEKNTNNNQDQAEPSFLPQNEESYGLYGHETGQLPPSTTTNTDHESKQPLHKYLPKNYNPVAYVTVPENTNEDTSEFREETNFDANPDTSNYNNGEENYYNGQLQKEEDFSGYRSSYPTTTSNNQEEGSEYVNNNNYYRLGSDFNSPRETTTRFGNNNNAEGFQRQGMSDTKFLENGKYHYDIGSGRFSRNHPYETLKGGNNENEFKGQNYESVGEYRNQYDKFSYEDNNMP